MVEVSWGDMKFTSFIQLCLCTENPIFFPANIFGGGGGGRGSQIVGGLFIYSNCVNWWGCNLAVFLNQNGGAFFPTAGIWYPSHN